MSDVTVEDVMRTLTREQAHAMIDDIFDAIDKFAESRSGSEFTVDRLRIQAEPDGSCIGGVLVLNGSSYISWDTTSHTPGLHSGHYDMSRQGAIEDWNRRSKMWW